MEPPPRRVPLRRRVLGELALCERDELARVQAERADLLDDLGLVGRVAFLDNIEEGLHLVGPAHGRPGRRGRLDWRQEARRALLEVRWRLQRRCVRRWRGLVLRIRWERHRRRRRA